MTRGLDIRSAERLAYDKVVAACPVTVPYTRFSTKPAHWWIGRALRGLLEASDLKLQDLDGFCLSSFTTGADSAIGIAQHMGLNLRWIDTIPMGGASGVLALRRAARAVQCGDANIVACVAGDTNHVDSFRQSQANFSRFTQDAVLAYGSGGAVASIALIAQHYMAKFGVTRNETGRVAVDQRSNALRNPNALMKKPLTLDAYLAARPVSEPLHLFDCVMPCAGAEAFLVMRQDTARAAGLMGARILSTIERHNANRAPVQDSGSWIVDIDELYQLAGVTPADMDVVQTYDDFPVISIMQFEDLGFCQKGEGADFVRSHDFTIGGSFPHNTSGGQLSVGQAGAAGSYIGLTEAIRQVTAQAGPTQVEAAQLALVSGFGMINYDRGLSAGAVILAGS